MRVAKLSGFMVALVATFVAAKLVGAVGNAVAAPTFPLRLIPGVQIEGEVQPDQSIEERMAYYGVPAVGIAVINGGAIESQHTLGSRSQAEGAIADTETLFQAASISKPVAAMIALKLVEEGVLSLDVDANTYLKRWQLPDSVLREGKAVTLRHLLSHQAGLSLSGFAGYAEDSEMPTLAGILRGENTNHPAIEFVQAPDAGFRYSGGGTTVAQMVMEDVTGLSLQALASKYVFEPLGMASSFYEQPLSAQWHTRAAHGHDRKGQALEGGRWHVYPEHAAAGLWTTPSDLAKFMIAVSNSLKGEEGAWLEQSLAHEAIGKYPDGTYAIGFRISGEGDNMAFSHTGANEGFRARAFMFPWLGKGLIVMTNGDMGSHLVREVFASAAKEFGWPAVEKPRLQNTIRLSDAEKKALVGAYLLASDGSCDERRVTVTLRPDGELEVNFGGFVARMLPDAKDHFFIMDSPLAVGVSRNDTGDIIGLTSFVNNDPYLTASPDTTGTCS